MLSRMFLRRMATSAGNQNLGMVPSRQGYKRIQELQTAFCRDDGLLVWQKGGTKDRVGFVVTMSLAILGFIPALGIIYKLSFPPKSD